MELVVHGPVPPDSEAYVHRTLDDRVLQALAKGEYVNIGGGRQTGKTSLLFRLRSFLRDSGAASAYIDLSPLGEASIQEDRWYQGVAEAIRTTLIPEVHRDNLPEPPLESARFRDYVLGIARVVGSNRPLVLLFDEVTAVPRELQHPLFSNIRALFNQRDDSASPKEASHVTFVFAGSFNPDRLIESQNSPFNVARTFDTSNFDFSTEQVMEVAKAVGLAEAAGDVFQMTAGHPYLTNRLLQVRGDSESVDEAVRRLLVSDSNLAHLGRRLGEAGEDAVELARKIHRGERIPYTQGISDQFDDLVVMGLIKANAQGDSVIRCEIYGLFLDRHQALTKQALIQGDNDSPVAFLPQGVLREQIGEFLEVAHEIANLSAALAVACIGAAIESALLVELEREGDLSNELAVLNKEVDSGNLESSLKIQSGKNDPTDWTLAQMIEIARLRGMITKPSSQVSHAIRAWRNLIHPAKLRREFPEGISAEVADAAIAIAPLLLSELRRWRTN